MLKKLSKIKTRFVKVVRLEPLSEHISLNITNE